MRLGPNFWIIILAVAGLFAAYHLEMIHFNRNKSILLNKNNRKIVKSASYSNGAERYDQLNMSINPEANEFQSGLSFSLRGFGNKSIPSFNATELEYFGSWQLANNSQTIPEFVNTKGTAVYFNNTDNKSLYIEIMDGGYEDQMYMILTLEYSNPPPNITNSTYINNSSQLNIYTFKHYEEHSNVKHCPNSSFNLTYFYADTMQPLNTTLNYKINASIAINASSNCAFAVNLMLSDNDNGIQAQAMNYSIVVTLMCCAHLYACIQLIKYFVENEAEANKLSLLTTGFFTCWDLLLCLFHLYQALSNSEYFHYFITPAFWYFIVATIFETRMLLFLWKVRYGNGYQTLQDLRRGVLVFYFKFYGFLIMIITLANYFMYSSWFLIFSSGMFLPQIVHNAIRGHRLKLELNYFFGLGLIRIILPLYAKGCPVNIFLLTPDDYFCLIYGGVVLFQVLFMHLQFKLGSRFFIPACLLPPKYNYFIDIPPGSEEEACAICMEEMNKPPTNASPDDPLIQKKKIKIMQTPCKHRFHEHCLKSWMNIKLECPLCKTAIPPLD